MTEEQVLNYGAAKSILEQAGVKFTDPNILYSTATNSEIIQAFEEETRRKKSRASKSQLRREARNG